MRLFMGNCIYKGNVGAFKIANVMARIPNNSSIRYLKIPLDDIASCLLGPCTAVLRSRVCGVGFEGYQLEGATVGGKKRAFIRSKRSLGLL